MELAGVLAAMLSSAIGGAAVGATRFVAASIDPIALGALRFGIGFLLLLPLALAQHSRWPVSADWLATASLGLLFFGAFPILFNASLHYTTAARGALALSTLPLLTMGVAALLRVEALTRRKTVGVLVAMAGVAIALVSGLAKAPPGAWHGDALMVGAALCMAVYSVCSRPIIRRSGPLPFTVVAMGCGAFALLSTTAVSGGLEPMSRFGLPQWLAVGFLGVFGGAVVFWLWSFALAHTTPTRVAISVTVNPVTAALVGTLILGEPITWNVLIGLLAVLVGICIATLPPRSSGRSSVPV